MRVLSVLTCVFLVSLMAGCAKPQTVVVPEYRTVDLPERFLAECRITEWRGGAFRGGGQPGAARRVDLEGCHATIAAAGAVRANGSRGGIWARFPARLRRFGKAGIAIPAT